MSRPKNAVPKIRPHSSGQARVTIEGRDYLLGKFGTPEAEEAYRRLLAQWLAKEGTFALKDDEPVTIAEVVAGYWLFAETYYGWDKNPHRGDAANTKATTGILDSLYGSTFAKDFGPLDLRAVQGEMVRLGWCRNMVNHEIGRVKRVFRWAVQEEMISASVWAALLAFSGLKKGKTGARESAPVKPVTANDVEAAKKYLRPALCSVIDFILLTACRPNEACLLRPLDIDRSNPGCWLFRLANHKTEIHEHERIILIGPRAQQLLAPLLEECAPGTFVFSPRREEERRNRQRQDERKSPMTPSQQARAERARLRFRVRMPRERYTTNALCRAIHRACEKAGIIVWGPNRLRHTRATELRPHGLDIVGTILGHKKLETTQIYSEKNLAAAMEVVAKVG